MNIVEWLDTDLGELQDRIHAVNPTQCEAFGHLILAAERLFVFGLGRSGLVMRMFALRLMQLGLQAYVVGDTTTPAIGHGDLLIVGSASGETEGALVVARQAQRAGARVALMTANGMSRLAQVAEFVLLVPGATPKSPGSQTSRLPSASVLEQAFLVVVDCLIASLAERLGQTNATMMARHANLE